MTDPTIELLGRIYRAQYLLEKAIDDLEELADNVMARDGHDVEVSTSSSSELIARVTQSLVVIGRDIAMIGGDSDSDEAPQTSAKEGIATASYRENPVELLGRICRTRRLFEKAIDDLGELTDNVMSNDLGYKPEDLAVVDSLLGLSTPTSQELIARVTRTLGTIRRDVELIASTSLPGTGGLRD